MLEEVSIPLTNIIICVLYLIVHLIAYSRYTAHISLPIIRPFFRFLQHLVRTLWCPYWGGPWGESVFAGEPGAGRSTGDCRPPAAANRACGTPNSAKTRLNTTNTDRHQRRKRKRKEDDEKGPPEQVPKLDPGQSSRPFACPFYLYNRHRWHNCLRNYTLNRIVDVRLHLTRAHALGPRCPICFEEFREDPAEPLSADDRFNAHIQLQTCQPLPSPPPSRDGLTRDQFEAVRTVGGRRSGRRVLDPAAEKWFEIWEIIFPDVPRPLSPYLHDHPDVQRIRDMNNEILSGEQWRNLTVPTRGSSPSLQNASRNTIQTILERLLPFYRLLQDPDRAAADIPVASSMDDSQQEPRDWELISAPSQQAQGTEDPLPSDHPPPAATGHDHGAFQQTRGYPLSAGQSHDITMTPVNQPLPILPNNMDFPGFFMDANLSDPIYNFLDVDDPLELPARTETPSQNFPTDFGPNPSGLWGQQGGDTADQA